MPLVQHLVGRAGSGLLPHQARVTSLGTAPPFLNFELLVFIPATVGKFACTGNQCVAKIESKLSSFCIFQLKETCSYCL
jgi:hypothetical protein